MKKKFSKTQHRMMEAVMELVAENGYTATTTKAIALKAEVNETTVFKNFENKQKLFSETFQERVRQLLDSIVVIINEPAETIEDFLQNSTQKVYELFIQQSNLVVITMREIGNTELLIAKETIVEQIINLVAKKLADTFGVCDGHSVTPLFMWLTSLMFAAIDTRYDSGLTDELVAKVRIEEIAKATINAII